ncbi:30S ribosomal protein S4 [bacterium I07]|nr:30S ribosomal protein S4 [bacterium I07]
MARYRAAVCKLCRREGEKLFLKGSRCLTAKCAFEKKGYPPGQHGKTRRMGKFSDYGTQLREKQKIKRYYGLLEAQFRETFEKANRKKGITSENMLKMLECRLDNVVFRMGFAPSRSTARQMVRHRHFTVNDTLVDIPSYQVKPDDIVQVRVKSRKLEVVHNSMKRIKEGTQLPWLSLDKANLTGTLLEVPERGDIPVTFNENLVVELYSK